MRHAVGSCHLARQQQAPQQQINSNTSSHKQVFNDQFSYRILHFSDTLQSYTIFGKLQRKTKKTFHLGCLRTRRTPTFLSFFIDLYQKYNKKSDFQ
jgi:hypothetical protein